jgi:hypothetical protein
MRYIFSYHGLCLRNNTVFSSEFSNKWDYSVPLLAEIKSYNFERRRSVSWFNQNSLRGLGDECGFPCLYAKKKGLQHFQHIESPVHRKAYSYSSFLGWLLTCLFHATTYVIPNRGTNFGLISRAQPPNFSWSVCFLL